MKGIGNLDKNSLGEMAWEKTDWSELKREMNKHEWIILTSSDLDKPPYA